MKKSKELKTAVIAAKKAGKILLSYYKKNVKFESKPDKSFVSEADLASEKIILNTLTKSFPKYSFYSEEKGKSEKSSDCCWYIDPLDGTHNFLHKIPMFGVSIALAKKNRFTLGVIYLPYLNELYYAEKGKGAFLNGKKIIVSKTLMKDSICNLPGSVTYNKGEISRLAKIFENYCKDIRMIGSTAIGLSYVACGKIDYYIKPSITPYDTGAGLVILEEAGGRITKVDGAEFLPEMKEYSFIASNNVFHDKLLKIMKEEFL